MALAYGVLPELRRPRLKALLSHGRRVRALEFHDPLSAMVAESASVADGEQVREFDLLWASGFSRAASQGLPDIEAAWFERRLDGIADAMRVTAKPVLVDADTVPDPVAFAMLCAALEALGVSAVMVEDKSGAKRTSLADGAVHELAAPEDFAATIAAGKAALRTGDLLVFARIEALIAGAGLAEALRRADVYLRSEADGLVIHSKDASGGDILDFLGLYRELQARIGIEKPIVVIPTLYNHLADTQLFDAGASIVIHANHMIRSAFKAMTEVARQILAEDRSKGADARCASVTDLIAAVGRNEHGGGRDADGAISPLPSPLALAAQR